MEDVGAARERVIVEIEREISQEKTNAMPMLMQRAQLRGQTGTLQAERERLSEIDTPEERLTYGGYTKGQPINEGKTNVGGIETKVSDQYGTKKGHYTWKPIGTNQGKMGMNVVEGGARPDMPAYQTLIGGGIDRSGWQADLTNPFTDSTATPTSPGLWGMNAGNPLQNLPQMIKPESAGYVPEPVGGEELPEGPKSPLVPPAPDNTRRRGLMKA